MPHNKGRQTSMNTITLPQMSGYVHISSPRLSDPTEYYFYCGARRTRNIHTRCLTEALASEQRPYCTGYTPLATNIKAADNELVFETVKRDAVLSWLSGFIKEAWIHLRIIIFSGEESQRTHTWSSTAERLRGCWAVKAQALYIRSEHNPDRLSQIHLWVNNLFNIAAKYNL